MTSLLQHHGGRSADGRKVELLFKRTGWPQSAETYVSADGKVRPVLWRAYRRPVGLFGCWVVFRYCGEEHVPDLSVPISIVKPPRDAKRLTDAEADAHWCNP